MTLNTTSMAKYAIIGGIIGFVVALALAYITSTNHTHTRATGG